VSTYGCPHGLNDYHQCAECAIEGAVVDRDVSRLRAINAELLEALERIFPSLAGTGHANTVRAAIRKAKGEL
jgi:hypothetical protein